jgi:hypothetical protein
MSNSGRRATRAFRLREMPAASQADELLYVAFMPAGISFPLLGPPI